MDRAQARKASRSQRTNTQLRGAAALATRVRVISSGQDLVGMTASGVAKRTFASTQHFVTDKELAKSYPVLHWANENALFDTLAGIELLSKHLNN